MKYLIDYTNFKLNEGTSLEGYQKTLNKILKDLKLDLYMITSFGVAFASFFPLVDRLIKNENFSFPAELVVVISLCALSIVLHENVEQIDKLKAYAKEKGVMEMVYKIVNVLKGIKNVFPKLLEFILKNTQTVAVSLINIFAYTSLCVPFMRALFDIVREQNITAESLAGYLVSASVGLVAIGVKNVISDLFDRVREKIKKKFGNKLESILIEEYNAIFS